jgi:site-specific DNA-methyltransferase (cytosine-N4-specific)
LGPDPSKKHRREYFKTLSDLDQEYLTAWFSEDILDSLDDIAVTINRVRDVPTRNLMWISLSNVLRSVSWQKEDDLRVRKEIRLDADTDPKKEFLEELGRSVRAVLALLFQNGPAKSGLACVSQGDARNPLATLPALRSAVDVVITSPPYATALPYLDTDRLSLCYLGLLPRSMHRTRDHSMIGNREVSEGLRRSYWDRFDREGAVLPGSVRDLIHHIHDRNSGAGVGFRRLNLPSLLAKYFFDMREALAGVQAILKPRATAFVVVGNNHTIAGGERVEIRTASLLRDIAQALGFETADSLSMEMLVSRDIFKKNASSSEEILAFRKA